MGSVPRLGVLRLAAALALAALAAACGAGDVGGATAPVGGRPRQPVGGSGEQAAGTSPEYLGPGPEVEAVTTTTTTTAVATTAVPPGPTTTSPPAGRPLRVLVMGDSPMWDAYPFIEAGFAAAGVEVRGGAFPGTSLLGRTDVRATFPRTVAEHRPDVVVAEYSGVYLPPYARGPDGAELELGSEAWWAAWRAAAVEATRVFSARGARVYWVLMPHTRDSWARGLPLRMNELYLSLRAEFPDLRFVDAVTPLSGPGGAYAEALPVGPGGAMVTVRAPDGGHFTEAGSRILARAIVATVLADHGLPVPG
jgi:hypothetical protein